MRYLRLLSAVALSVLVVSMTGPARADDKSCAEYRENIIRMERESVRPPGWYALDRYLRLAYVADCITHPAPQRPTEYWFRIDGTPTGIPGSGDRPADGAYLATPEIGAQCAGTTNPSMCAMMTGVTKSCVAPADPQQRYLCWMLLGEDRGPPPTPVPASADLPPPSVTVDGQTYALPPACERAFNGINGGAASDASKAAQLAAYRRDMQAACPALLAALERRLGGDPAGFWPGLEQLMLAGFPPAGATPVTMAGIAADPGFQRMCRQANDNMNTCAQRQANMRTCVPDPVDPKKCATDGPVGTAGQAGAFNSCRILYGQVLAMCDPKNHAVFASPRPAPRAPQQAAPPPPPKANPNAPQQSSAPPAKPAANAMSPKCQKLVSDYVAASQANDGPKAVAGYNALKQEGGCSVLAKVDKPVPAAGAPSANDSKFLARGSPSLSDQVMGRCDAAPDVCAARVQQLRAGVSPEAVSALWMHAIGVGLELGSAMANAAASAAAASQPAISVPSGGSNMNSIGNRPVRSTYGQGSPTGPPPVTRYGDGLHSGTAR